MKLKDYLLSLGFKEEKERKVCNCCTINKTLYTKGDKCVIVTKFGRKKPKISVLTNWNSEHKAGTYIEYDTTEERVLKILK